MNKLRVTYILQDNTKLNPNERVFLFVGYVIARWCLDKTLAMY
jgi:hypothetical protein